MAVLTAVDVEQAPHRPITVGYDLAGAYDETLVVVYVMPEAEYDHRRHDRPHPTTDSGQQTFTVDQARDTAAARAGDAVETALNDDDRQSVETRGRVGTPPDEILMAAEEIDPRYIVVGGRRRSSVRQAIFGSVSQTIMRNAHQPVVTLIEEEG